MLQNKDLDILTQLGYIEGYETGKITGEAKGMKKWFPVGVLVGMTAFAVIQSIVMMFI